jgi:4-amino-4-deoxy-L-arabinose transferase-like glycosyltransferase
MKIGRKFLVTMFLFLALVAIGSYRIDASGETMDEWYHFFVSRRVMSAILHFDFSEEAHGYRTDQPPMYKYIYGPAAVLTQRFVPNNPSYSMFNLTYTRITSVAVTALTAVIVLLFGWEFFSPLVGIFAALIFFFLPYVLAYARVVSSDMPGTLFFSLTAYLFTKAITRSGNNRYYFFATLALAGTLLSKYNNVLILPLIGSIFAIYKFEELRMKRSVGVPLFLLLMIPLAGILFFVGWPWLWGDTLTRFTISLNHWLKMSQGMSNLNLQYFPIYFAITTPVLVLLGLALFLASLLKDRREIKLVLLLWLIVPFGVSVSKYKIDGVRFVTGALVPLSLACILGYHYLADLFSRFKKVNFKILLPLLVLIYEIVLVVQYHPYYLDYFNEFIGGPRQAAERGIPVGYWGEGVKEAVGYLNRVAEQNATVRFAISEPTFIPHVREDLKVLEPFVPQSAQSYMSTEDYAASIETSEKAMYLVQYVVGVEDVSKFYDKIYASKVRDYELAQVFRLKDEFISD